MGGELLNEGRVELRVHGLWGTICDKNFGPNDAAVICRMMSYLGASVKF